LAWQEGRGLAWLWSVLVEAGELFEVFGMWVVEGDATAGHVVVSVHVYATV
jgi:hypothetical protein